MGHWAAELGEALYRPLVARALGVIERLRRPKLLTYPGFPTPFGV